MERERNTTIDLAKYIASLLIIGIHTSLFTDVNDTAGFFVTQIFCRLAVPFFAVCTGYFLSPRLVAGGKLLSNKMPLWKQEKKLIQIYFVWSILYLFYSIPTWIETGWFSVNAFLDYFVSAILNGAHYQLWYLMGLIYALPILLIILPLLNRRKAIVGSIVGYLLWLLYYSYRWLLPQSGAMPFDVMDRVFAISSGILLLVPLILLGMEIEKEKDMRLGISIAGFCASFLMMTIEAFLLHSIGQEKVSYIIFSYPAAYFLFHLLLNIKSNRKIFSRLGEISLIIYCVHPMIIELLDDKIKSSVILFLVTVILASVIGLIWIKAKQFIMGRKGTIR